MIILSTCHNIGCEFTDNNINYIGTSPDEIAMINFAKMFGFVYQGKNEDNLIVEY